MTGGVEIGENRAPRFGVPVWAGEWAVTVDGREVAEITETETGYRLRSNGAWVRPERGCLSQAQEDAREIYGTREAGKP